MSLKPLEIKQHKRILYFKCGKAYFCLGCQVFSDTLYLFLYKDCPGMKDDR